MAHDQPQRPRDYGGWRRRRGIGLFGLGPAGTFAVLGALVVVILVAAANVRALVYLGPPVLAATGIGLARRGGEPLANRAIRRLRWWQSSARRYPSYRVNVVAAHCPAFQLPGVDRKSTRLNSSHRTISYAVFCLKKKKKNSTISLHKKKKKYTIQKKIKYITY